MQLEQQVTSLKLSKRLKELGVKQEALFWWSEHTSPATLWSEDAGDRSAIWDTDIQYAAFTVAELGEMLPCTIDGKYGDCTRWYNSRITSAACVWYDNGRDDEKIEIVADTEADARAKMLIYLLENKLITV